MPLTIAVFVRKLAHREAGIFCYGFKTWHVLLRLLLVSHGTAVLWRSHESILDNRTYNFRFNWKNHSVGSVFFKYHRRCIVNMGAFASRCLKASQPYPLSRASDSMPSSSLPFPAQDVLTPLSPLAIFEFRAAFGPRAVCHIDSQFIVVFPVKHRSSHLRISFQRGPIGLIAN